MTRIKVSDTGPGIVAKMADGNPGAVHAMARLLTKECEKIDPDSALGLYGPLLTLDRFGIYGTSIYILWKDKCRRNLRQFVLLLRASQLGLLPDRKIKEMAADQMGQVNLTDDEWDDLDTAVCDQLAGFISVESWDAIHELSGV